MSASLVGSEMCIRDRSRPALSRHRFAYATPLPSLPGPHGPALNEAAPVSYTHLTLPTICSV
eukprot:15344098-Alexandrium_andersonii.AAC.1